MHVTCTIRKTKMNFSHPLIHQPLGTRSSLSLMCVRWVFECKYRCHSAHTDVKIESQGSILIFCLVFWGVGECGGSTLFATVLHTLGKLAYKLLGEISYLHSHLTLGVPGLKMCTSTSGFCTGFQNLN